MTIRTRAMVLVIIIMLSLSAVFLFAGKYFQDKYIDYSFRRFDRQLAGVFGRSIDEVNQKYFGTAYSILQNPDVLKSFAEKDRQKLFLEMLPLYRDLRAKDNFFFVMHFMDKDGFTVLRMHKPDSYGDNLTDVRPLVKYVNTVKKEVVGFEVGKNGVFFRIITPAFYNGEYIGMLDLGIRSSFLTESISRNMQFRSAVFIRKDKLAAFENGEFLPKLGYYSILNSNDSIFTELKDKFDPGKEALVTKLNGVYYSFHNGYELKDYSGTPFAYLVVAQDVNSEIKDFRKGQIYLSAVVLLCLVLATAILNYSFRTMLIEIEEGRKSLSKHQRTDSLTGLPNRNALIKDIEHKDNPVLILLNIDRFKEINEVFGIGAGDQVLKEYSLMLKQYMKDLDEMFPEIHSSRMLYRLGRDEFVILIDGYDNTEDRIAEYISYKTDSEIIDYQGIEIAFSVSIGISRNRDKPLQSADTALKMSRDRKKNYMHFDESMEHNQHQSNNFYWLNKVKQAIKDDRIVPYFQGIMDNATGEVNKYECLIRMIEPDGNVVSPGMFLPVIKKTKLYPELTKIMICKSIEHFKNKDKEFSINISTEDILNKDMVFYIKDMLASHGMSAQVTFEVLETDNIGNYEEVSEFITEVKQLGCKVAIDDFGTGYSNFTHLMNLDFDYLKIDGSLIQNIHRDNYTRRLVKSIEGFANGMKIKTVAEFVSSAEILEAVKQLNIDYSQGYYVSKPLPDTD